MIEYIFLNERLNIIFFLNSFYYCQENRELSGKGLIKLAKCISKLPNLKYLNIGSDYKGYNYEYIKGVLKNRTINKPFKNLNSLKLYSKIKKNYFNADVLIYLFIFSPKIK